MSRSLSIGIYIDIGRTHKIWYCAVKDSKAAGKPKLSLAAVKSGKKVPNFSESVLNDL